MNLELFNDVEQCSVNKLWFYVINNLVDQSSNKKINK